MGNSKTGLLIAGSGSLNFFGHAAVPLARWSDRVFSEPKGEAGGELPVVPMTVNLNVDIIIPAVFPVSAAIQKDHGH